MTLDFRDLQGLQVLAVRGYRELLFIPTTSVLCLAEALRSFGVQL